MPAVADPPTGLEALPWPQLSAIGQLVAELWATTRALARWYEEAGARTRIEGLRAALEALAAGKAAQAGVLEPFVETVGRLGVPASPFAPPPVPATGPMERGAPFSMAFPAERALAVGYRELAALLPDTALFPALGSLAAQAARDQATLRRLYLQYS